jgi:hypothetical protein
VSRNPLKLFLKWGYEWTIFYIRPPLGEKRIKDKKKIAPTLSSQTKIPQNNSSAPFTNFAEQTRTILSNNKQTPAQ